MDSITITHTLIRATSLDQFRNDSGTARLRQPYWVGSAVGALVFDFIHSHTDKETLTAQIHRGEVWIQEKYG